MSHGTTAPIRSDDSKGRRRRVEERLRALGRPVPPRRAPPPEGRLAGDERPSDLRAALVDLGPVFAAFGRYLSTRIDLLPRREYIELARIDDRGAAMPESELKASLRAQLGGTIEDRFFAFEATPGAATLWTQQHDAWLAPGAQVVVTVVRPDAAALLGSDLPLLPLLGPWLHVPDDALALAIDDFGLTLNRRLDQTLQAAALVRLAGDAREGGALTAPVCYRDYCAAGVLTLERVEGVPLGAAPAPGDLATLAQRLTTAWLRQAAGGHVVPFDFDSRHIVVSGDRLVLTDAAFEPQPPAGRARFVAYLNAVAAADPVTAWAWIAGAAAPGSNGRSEEELRRRLRQAVPFRDGEWSGDDRLAEQVLVQWRVTREAGWRLDPHQLHMYRGLQAINALAERLAPAHDPLIAALESERLRVGFAEARRLFDPRALPGTLDTLLENMVSLPQKLDDVLTLAAEGRLSVKLHVPDAPDQKRVRDRTVSLVASLVALTALAFLLRQVASAYGGIAEGIGMVLLLIVGGWLLIAAARL
jgi:ubiquinone biosynthesis protein